jgi:hypothetical protein
MAAVQHVEKRGHPRFAAAAVRAVTGDVVSGVVVPRQPVTAKEESR